LILEVADDAFDGRVGGDGAPTGRRGELIALVAGTLAKVRSVTGDELGERFAAALAGRRVQADGASLVLVEWRDPGGAGDRPRYIAPLHVHLLDDEAWYVVEGTLTVRAGEHDVTLPTGGAALVPRGTPHTFWNPRSEPTRYLIAMSARIAALIDDLHALEARDEATIAAVFESHASAYLGWP
jgi:mannose-6-phosphate isomerase-like protein (cupin superfamily)